MKKLFKLLLILVLTLGVLLAGALVVLRQMYPDEKLKAMAQDYAKNNLQREISFDEVSLNLVGVTLSNFALSENTSFQNGTFIKADKLLLKMALLPLLKKRIEIATMQLDGLDVNLIKNQDGSFNFDTLSSSSNSTPDEGENSATQPPKEEEPLSFALLADKISVTDCDVSYQDLQTGMKAAVNDLNIQIDDLDLADPFDVLITFTTSYQEGKGPAVSIPVRIALNTNLANLDLPNAYATIQDISATYKTVRFALTGEVKNFQAPQVNLTGSLAGINNVIFADFLPDLPNFQLPVIRMNLQAAADLDKSTATISHAKLSVGESALSANGKVGWASETPTYTLNGTLTTNLAELIQMTDTVQGFNPGGVIAGNFKATDKKDGKDVTGKITLKDVSALYDPFVLTQLNGTIVLASLDDISASPLTGQLNNSPFTSSFSYKNLKDVMDIVFDLDLEKLTLQSFPSSQETEKPAQATAETTAGTQPTPQTPETMMNLKANVKVGALAVPYFRADGLTLNADLTGVSESMKKANGTVSFALQPGAITDLEQLIKGNKMVRIILLPLAILNKVAGKLNVELFPVQAAAKKGEITYSTAEGLYTFTDGLMTITSTKFNSQVTDIKGSGTINFATQDLNMRVSAALVTKQTPVVIKIGGTMDNPKGKLDVVNTVGSIVGGILSYKTPVNAATGTAKLAGNVAEGAAKTSADTAKATADAAAAALKGIGGLFKKKDKTPSEPESN